MFYSMTIYDQEQSTDDEDELDNSTDDEEDHDEMIDNNQTITTIIKIIMMLP